MFIVRYKSEVGSVNVRSGKQPFNVLTRLEHNSSTSIYCSSKVTVSLKHRSAMAVDVGGTIRHKPLDCHSPCICLMLATIHYSSSTLLKVLLLTVVILEMHGYWAGWRHFYVSTHHLHFCSINSVSAGQYSFCK